ncbi:MAG: hypothetical protein AAFV45_12785 [Pseudomonadota bacterium]
MQRVSTTKNTQTESPVERSRSRSREGIRAVVRLLARQAAEKDFEAFAKAQEAANDND